VRPVARCQDVSCWAIPGDMRRGCAMQQANYPVQFAVDYPDRPLDRVSTFFRLVIALPILLVLASVAGGTWTWKSGYNADRVVAAGAGGLLFFAPLLLIVFRRKYPRWWFDWNQELLRFSNRVSVYLALMDDRYPATEEQQGVHLDYPYPDVPRELNRWLPLVKWFLTIPHYVILLVLLLAALVAVVIAWFVILLTERYPPDLFRFVEGVLRWHNRVLAYAVLLVTDRYPPFRLAP